MKKEFIKPTAIVVSVESTVICSSNIDMGGTEGKGVAGARGIQAFDTEEDFEEDY